MRDDAKPSVVSGLSDGTDPARTAGGVRPSPAAASDAILRVESLGVTYRSDWGPVHAVDGVSFEVRRGEIFGLVGESGCGKSATLRAMVGLLPPETRTDGRVEYEGSNLLAGGNREWRNLRGSHLAMIFQDPMTALNPVLRVREQIDETLRRHTKLTRPERRARAVELMRLVGIAAPQARLDDYPHQFSGGMRQRVLIAIALSCSPSVLLADEPTTALDVTIQDQILRLLKHLRQELDMSMILVSHDLGVIAQMCDRVAVMYAGQIVELASAREIVTRPRHPYTIGLLESLPGLTRETRYLKPIPGSPPGLHEASPKCRFLERCPARQEQCADWISELREVSPQHLVRCVRAGEAR